MLKAQPCLIEAWVELLAKALQSAAGARNRTDLLLVCRAATSTFQKLGPVFKQRASDPSSGSGVNVAPQLEASLKAVCTMLASITVDPGIEPDCVLLAGMAIGYLLKLLNGHSLSDQAAAVHAVMFGGSTSAISGIPSWLVSLPGDLAEIAELAVIRGAVSVLDKEVLLSSWDAASAAQGKTLLFDEYFPRLRALSHSRSPVALWLAHSSLALWISTTGAAAKKQPERVFAACNFLSVYKASKSEAAAAAAAAAGTSATAAAAASAASPPLPARAPQPRNVKVAASLFEELTRLIWESWEHPVQEIRNLTKSMFADLLTLLESQSSWASKSGKATMEALIRSSGGGSAGGSDSGYTYEEVPATGFCELLAVRLARSQWHVKGRYGLLSTIAARLGMGKLLLLAPTLLDDCVRCLQVNSLAPQGIRLISDLSKAARKEWEVELFGKYKGPLTTRAKANLAELESREVAVAARWDAVWKGLLLGALTSNDQHTRTEVALHWLPETMKLFPAALNNIVADFSSLLGYAADGSGIEGYSDTSPAEVRSRRLHALMVTIKSARSVGLISSSSLRGGPTSENDGDNESSSADEDDDEDADANAAADVKSSSTHSIAVPYALVCEALCHSECQIQMAGLSFICSDPRTTAEVTTAEVALLREFVPRNLNMSDAGGRHHFLSLMKALLCRLRDSWIAHNTASDAVTRKLMKHDLEHGSEVECDACLEWIREMDGHEDGIARTGDVMVEVVNWLASITIASMYPGASYQRSLTSIRLFSMIYSVFNRSALRSSNTNKSPKGNKMDDISGGGGGASDASPADEEAAAGGSAWPEWPDDFPNLSSELNMSVLISAVYNSHDDVRTAASSLLANDFNVPIRFKPLDTSYPGCDSGACLTASEIANAARTLASSGNPHKCAVGAELFRVIFANFVVNRNGHFTSKTDGAGGILVGRIRTDAASSSSSSAASVVAFVTLMLDLIQAQLNICRADLVAASRESAPNGMIFALKHIWTALDASLTADDGAWQTLVARTIGLMLDVGTFALNVLLLDTKVDDEANTDADADADADAAVLHGFPSLHITTDYGNTDDALDKAMSMHSPASGTGVAGTDTGESDTRSAGSLRTFVFAMAWRTVKETSLFLGSMFDASILPGESATVAACVDVTTLDRIGTWMQRVLVSSRHRGVIETCATGFGTLCKRLSKSINPDVQQIPSTWLESCIALMTSDAVGRGSVSITRRGAGLPYVIHAIVANERNPKIVARAFSALLEIAADQSVPPEWDERMDLPSVRALNALNILFRDAGLGDASQPFMAEASIIAINGFAASEWALANTCMMVFGTLAQKMLGTKRVKDDRSHINLITAREFFARYPLLRGFIRDRLQAIVVASRTITSCDRAAAAFSTQPTPGTATMTKEGTAATLQNRLFEPELYPLLTLLARLQSNAEADPEQAAEMQTFAELLAELTGNCIFAIRNLAARALVPMIALSECGNAGIMWLAALPDSSSKAVVAQNHVHGALLAVKYFLSAWLTAPANSRAGDAGTLEVAAAMAKVAWLLDPTQNTCSFVAAAYGNICNMLLSAKAATGTSDEKENMDFDFDFEVLADALRTIPIPEEFEPAQYEIGDWWRQTSFVEVVWRTRIIATGTILTGDVDADAVPSLSAAAAAASRSLLLTMLVQTSNADVRRHVYALLVQTGSTALHTLPEDVGQIVAWACYCELKDGDPADRCKTGSVEALVAIGSDAITFPANGVLQASTLWDYLMKVDQTIDADDGTPVDERLQEICIVAQGMLLSAVVAEKQTAGDALQRAEYFVSSTLRASKTDLGISMYGEASTARLAVAKCILLGIDAVFASAPDSNRDDPAFLAMESIRVPVLRRLSEALQDEDSDIREVASAAIAKIRTPAACGVTPEAAAVSPPQSLQSTIALEMCYDFMYTVLQASVDRGPPANGSNATRQYRRDTLKDAWAELISNAAGRNPDGAFDDFGYTTAACAGGSADHNRPLFAKENSNTFVESLCTTQLAVLASYKLLTEGSDIGVNGEGFASLQRPCKELADRSLRERFMPYAAAVAKQSCAILLQHMTPQDNNSMGNLSGRFVHDDLTGRCPTFAAVYRSIVVLAASTFAVGACLYADDPASSSVVAISRQIPLLAETVEMLRMVMDAGKMPVVLRLAASQLRAACTSWTPKASAGTRAYAALLSAQVAVVATTATLATDDFLRMLDAASDDSEPLGMFGGEASPYFDEGGEVEAAFDCPFRCSIPFNFFSP